jgi:hypothetical protein
MFTVWIVVADRMVAGSVQYIGAFIALALALTMPTDPTPTTGTTTGQLIGNFDKI